MKKLTCYYCGYDTLYLNFIYDLGDGGYICFTMKKFGDFSIHSCKASTFFPMMFETALEILKNNVSKEMVKRAFEDLMFETEKRADEKILKLQRSKIGNRQKLEYLKNEVDNGNTFSVDFEMD